MRKPCWNGNEDLGMYPGVGGALLLPLFLLAVRVCSVHKGEGGEILSFFLRPPTVKNIFKDTKNLQI